MKQEHDFLHPLVRDDMRMRATTLDMCLLAKESNILIYLSYLGVNYHQQSTLVKVWCGLLSFIYVSYFVCFLVEFIIGLIFMFGTFFWVMCLVMMIKCALLYVAVGRMRSRLQSPVYQDFLVQVEEAVQKAKLYFYVTIFFNLATIVLNIITKTINGEVGVKEIYFYIMLGFGSSVFTGYMAAVILFSVADARVAQHSVKNLIDLTKENLITPGVYIETLTRINGIVEDSFWLDGALLSCFLMNTVAAIVLLLIYNNFTHGESVLYTISFLLYVLMIMWITDLVFLFLVIPDITHVNDLFIDFHRALARKYDFYDTEKHSLHCSNHSSSLDMTVSTSLTPLISSRTQTAEDSFCNNASESGMSYRPSMYNSPDEHAYLMNRNNTLHLVVSEPIRYTIIGGLYWNTKEFWNSVIAVVCAVCFSVGRFVFLVIISDS